MLIEDIGTQLILLLETFTEVQEDLDINRQVLCENQVLEVVAHHCRLHHLLRL